jgi:RNA polymerase sigma factor (sigma-70 family)
LAKSERNKYWQVNLMKFGAGRGRQSPALSFGKEPNIIAFLPDFCYGGAGGGVVSSGLRRSVSMDEQIDGSAREAAAQAQSVSHAQAVPHVPRAFRLLALRDDALRLSQRIGGRRLSEDIVQEAYLRAVRAGVPALDDAALRKWFLQVAANAARDMLRSDNRRRQREARYMDNELSTANPGIALSAERAAQLECAFAALDPRQREVLTLRYDMGLSFDDVAQILDTPAPTLRVVAQRAMQALRQALGAQPATELRGADDAQLGAMLALLPIAPLSGNCNKLLGAIVNGSAPGLTSASAEPAATTTSGPGAGIAINAGGTGLVTKLFLLVAGAAAMLAFGAVLYFMLGVNAPVPPPTTVSTGPVEKTSRTDPPAFDVRAFTDLPGIEREPVATAPVGAAPVAAAPAVRAVPPIPAVAPEDAGWNNALELLKKARPAQDTVAGTWSVQGDDLIVKPEQYARIMLPLEPVAAEYDLRVDFVRESGVDDVCILVPYRERTIALKIGAFGNTRAFFDTGTQTQDLRSAAPPGILQNTTRYSAVVSLRGTTLRAEINGRPVAATDLGETPTGTEPGWRLPDPRRLGIGAWQSTVRFQRIALRAAPVVVADDGAKAAPAAGAAEEAALIRSVPDVDAEQVGGAWPGAKRPIAQLQDAQLEMAQGFMRVNDSLRAAARAPAKIGLGYQPPEEYDVRVRFKRTSGNKDVVLMLTQNGRPFCWKVGGWGNSVAGFDTIAGAVSAKSRGALMIHNMLTNNRSYTTVVQVRRDGLRAYLDGHLMMTWRGDYESFAIEPFWEIGDPLALGVGSYDSAVEFEEIEVREITAPAAPNSGAPNSAPPAVRPPLAPASRF